MKAQNTSGNKCYFSLCRANSFTSQLGEVALPLDLLLYGGHQAGQMPAKTKIVDLRAFF